ncbi:MAG TPA: META domain-containing protein [Candidatus Paceibacterota bacterium]|nr:META domain-containing protein [Candidatus Paceibacterota bacterium]
MNRKIAWTLVVLIILGLAGYAAYAKYAGTLPVPAIPSLSDGQSTATALPEDSSWEWLETVRADGSGMTPAEGQPFIVTFAADRSFGIDGDCNTMGSTYLLGEGNGLTLAPLFSTKMFCEGSRETEFAADIATVSGYALAGDELTLTLTDGGAMRFARVPQPL